VAIEGAMGSLLFTDHLNTVKKHKNNSTLITISTNFSPSEVRATALKQEGHLQE
jgi:hypothetical protein